MTTKLFVLATILLVPLTASATDYTWPATNYGGLSATDYSWGEPVTIETPKAPVQETQPVAYYPTHPVRWNVNGYWNYSREYIIEHLLGGEHRGKFSREWLEALSMKEAQSLHDDDHENRVQWQYVGKPAQVAKPVPKPQPVQRVTTPAPVRYQSNQSCPNGNCPDQRFQRRGGLFRIFKRR